MKSAFRNIINEFFNSFQKNLLTDDISKEEQEKYYANNYIIPYLKFVKKNKNVFKIFVENLQSFNANEYYNFLLEKVFIPVLNKKGIHDQTTIKYISKYYLSGVTSVVLDWINRNCEDEIEYISNIILICNKYALL